MIVSPVRTGSGARPLFLPDEYLRSFAPAAFEGVRRAMVVEVKVVQVIRVILERDRPLGSVLAPPDPTGVGSGPLRDRICPAESNWCTL